MFTGIISDLGRVKRLEKKTNVLNLILEPEKGIPKDIRIGDSVNVNGVCLTVIRKDLDLNFQIMPETLKKTNLGELRINDRVNLEYPLRVSDRISGHFVYGHIDCFGVIRKKSYIKNNLCFEVSYPKEISKYIVPKGSIAVDGISLTIGDKKSDSFTVYIIPYTLKNTNLQFRKIGDKVNLECDFLAKIAIP